MNVITQQPGIEAVVAAYSPIIFKYKTDAPSPVAFCDIYINGLFYRSDSKTYSIDNEFTFDIRGSLQEYLKKVLGANGGTLIIDASIAEATVFCRFRSTYLNGSGFIDSTYTAPVQGTDSTSPVEGTGEESEVIYVLNVSLRQTDNTDLKLHFSSFKYNWPASPNIYPLLHRPAKHSIGPNQSDYYPIFMIPSGPDVTCIKVNYRLKNSAVWASADTCAVSEIANLVWTWHKLNGDMIDLTGCIDGSFTKINWGDGTVNSLLTHQYVETGDFTVQVFDSTTTILLLANKFGPSRYNISEVSAWPATLVTIKLYNNEITSLPSFGPLVNVVLLQINQNQIATLNISTCVLLDELSMANNLITSALNLATNTIMTKLFAGNNQISSITNLPATLLWIQAEDNTLPASVVNSILTTLDGNGLGNGVCQLQDQTPPASPSGAGIPAKANLISKLWNVNTD